MWKWILGAVAGVAAIGGAIWYEEKKTQANANSSGGQIQSSTADTGLGSGTGDQSQPVGSAANPASAD